MEVHGGNRETNEQVTAVIHVGIIDGLDLGGKVGGDEVSGCKAHLGDTIFRACYVYE